MIENIQTECFGRVSHTVLGDSLFCKMFVIYVEAIMAITRYEPWGLLTQLQRELERARDDMATEGASAIAEWAPAVDIKEESDKFIVHADLPGVKPEAIDVTTENGVLTIKGEKQTEARTEKEGYKRVERTHGSFLPPLQSAGYCRPGCDLGCYQRWGAGCHHPQAGSSSTQKSQCHRTIKWMTNGASGPRLYDGCCVYSIQREQI